MGLPLVLIASAARWRCGTSVLVLCSMASRVDETAALPSAAAASRSAWGPLQTSPERACRPGEGYEACEAFLVCLTR